ncbi:glycosidase [Thermocatellispora tengchongensis]|uniref:Glycosidase n=1 Tax=Thermocatellispora tengchongensis TaxID=1073253 RepID=A0A840NWM9_9ACTN|nr:alpha-amylase family glycosyl hydrolase [Thermocatellispora tengchongensis]MBB5130596.1 glycosidase [Thermocatellispora tengchongensis]
MKRLLSALLLLIPLLAFTPPARAVTSPGPLAEGDVIYHVVVDRFHNGDTSNDDTGNGEYDPDDLGFYHGGDWAGLTAKLDYIKNLGVTAIWISPVSEQEPLSRDQGEAGYHGYFTKNFATPNTHFGSTAELQTLIDTAHAKGLKMILDVVPNHTTDYLAGTSTVYNPPSYKPAPPLDNANYFHHIGDCDFDGSMTQAQLELCDLGGLDAPATTSSACAAR